MVLLVMAACSGTGKSTLAKRLLARSPKLLLSVSATTRAPRESEIDGVHYHFVGRDRFEAMIEQDELAEWAEYAGNLYGTPRAEVSRAAARGHDLLLDVEVVGAAAIRERYPEAVSVFILPPSWAALEGRLRGRGTESEASIRRRLLTAVSEIDEADAFDYLVQNDDLEQATVDLEHVYHAACLRARERLSLLQCLRQR